MSRRTVSVETPVASAVARKLAPPARTARICAALASVSREGRLGPFFTGASPFRPVPSRDLRQRRNDSVLTPKAAATSLT
ncbi:hypothetical protein AAFM46_10500 [Arthrobacter sp. TMP15]|uniref:hypothetical protein n=1 Tax=Arthrobacter sp. TMP15 TaxID=3140789 RepID=UPI0031BA484B